MDVETFEVLFALDPEHFIRAANAVRPLKVCLYGSAATGPSITITNLSVIIRVTMENICINDCVEQVHARLFGDCKIQPEVSWF